MKNKIFITAIFLLSPALVGPMASSEPPEDFQIVARDDRGVPIVVRGSLGSLAGERIDRAAADFLPTFAESHLGARGTETFEAILSVDDELGQTHVRTRQLIAGLPVEGVQLIVHLDRRSLEVVGVSGTFAADELIPPQPRMGGERALAMALSELTIPDAEILEEPSLVYHWDADASEMRLAWVALVRYGGVADFKIDLIFVDATTGAFLERQPQIHTALDRETYTANNTFVLPGTLLIDEGGASADIDAQAAHDHAGTTYAFYWDRFKRDSLDDDGMTLVSTVHVGINWPGAGWSRANQQMVYGDGDGWILGPASQALDVVAHELTHGITSFESDLVYMNESGAINESLSDVFGAAVEAWVNGMSSDVWKLGEEVFTPGIPLDAIRYMNDPVLDHGSILNSPSVDFYPDLYTGPLDEGGVHRNSGISNLAFYLVSQGGRHPRNRTFYPIAGMGIEKATDIYYRAQQTYLMPKSDFRWLRLVTELAAGDLFGVGSNEQETVRAAWCAVGVELDDCPIDLTTAGDTIANLRLAWLVWKNAPSADVDIFRSNVSGPIATVAAAIGNYTDHFDATGAPSSLDYWICEAGTTSSYDPDTCSRKVTTTF